MTENLYKALEELNDAMYTLDYDMSDIKDVRSFKNKLERLSGVVNGLLAMSQEKFNKTIKEFDKQHLGDLYEEQFDIKIIHHSPDTEVKNNRIIQCEGVIAL